MGRVGRTLAAWIVGALLASACGPSAPPKPEHVVLIVIDTLRADHLGVLGYPRPTSPTLDRLARGGVLCTRAISQSSFTSPSMVSLMTGRYIAKERLDVPAELATIAETFQQGGWATGGFASNPLISAENGFARGFERFEKIDEYGSNEPIADWLEQARSRRTFTYVHVTEPHDPYLAPEGQRQWRDAASYLPGDRAEYYARIAAELGLEGTSSDIAQIQAEIGGYDDDVRYADARVGEILALYERAGLTDETLFVVTADHGEGLWEHVALMSGQRGTKLARGEKPSLVNTLMPTHGNQVHRELVHVPIILAGPGLPKATPINAPVENVDLYPTLLEMCDLPTPGGLQGESLLRWLDGSSSGEDFAFSFTRFNTTVIDSKGWTLILPTDEGVVAEGLEVELYQISSDPHQRRNRANDEPERVAKLTEVARERIRIAIGEGSGISNSNLRALHALGYLDQVERENKRRVLVATPIETLLEKLTTFDTPAVERLAIVDALRDVERDSAANARLSAWHAKETSVAVKRALDALLAK